MSIVVKVTNKIKGEFIVPTLSDASISPGQTYNIDESEYHNSDIKKALALGFLSIPDDSVIPEKSIEKTIKLKNKTSNNIVIRLSEGENVNIEPKKAIFVDMSVIEGEPVIQAFLNQGILEMISGIDGPDDDGTADKIEENNTDDTDNTDKEVVSEDTDTDTTDTDTTDTMPTAWDPRQKKSLSNEEAYKQMFGDISVNKEKEIQWTDDDKDEEDINWVDSDIEKDDKSLDDNELEITKVHDDKEKEKDIQKPKKKRGRPKGSKNKTKKSSSSSKAKSKKGTSKGASGKNKKDNNGTSDPLISETGEEIDFVFNNSGEDLTFIDDKNNTEVG